MSAGKGIVGHGAQSAPPQPGVMEQPISRKVEFLGAQIVAGTTPDGNRLLSIIDPGSQTVYQVTLTPEGAREVGKGLISTVPIADASEMPGGGS